MSKLSELQNVELDILTMFSAICRQEDLSWFAMYGTLLGTARHSGFIPWDDDIDIAMPRADYDRLRNNPQLFSEPYFLQTPANDPSAAPRFLRLRRSDTTVMKDYPDGLIRGGNMGAYIDIMPLDFVPNIKDARKMRAAAIRVHEQMLASAALDENAGEEIPDWKAEICYGYGGIAGYYGFFAQRYEWICSRYSDEPYYVIAAMGPIKGYGLFNKKWFDSYEMMQFENVEVPVPEGWRELLAVCYPEGTLTPGENERDTKHERYTVVDMNRSYKYYAARYTDMLKNIEGKRVFIFGAADSLRIWLERYSQGLEVVCAFDNAQSKWGTEAFGVSVRDPSELPGLLDKNSVIIIASIYHKEISMQLESMGISDYYIFIDGLKYKRCIDIEQ